MKVTKNLMNNIPLEKRDTVINKMEIFEKKLLESKSLSDIPKGFWVRKIYNTDIYKFRINSGDRILFKYDNSGGKDSILFIDYCNHDSQILTAKNYRGTKSVSEFEINESVYEEDEFDSKINDYIEREVYSKLETLKKELVIDDEYIALSIEDDENMYFLSQEQYECLNVLTKPIIVLGCAGSGKTMIAVRKLIVNNDLNIDTAYITNSKMIVNKTQDMFNRFSDNGDNISFLTFEKVCKDIIGFENEITIKYEDFCAWMLQNEVLKDTSLQPREVWIEINTIIKGKSGDNIDNIENGFLEKDSYFSCEESEFQIDEKRLLYKIAGMYDRWLKSNNYYDDNDLARIALDKLDKSHMFEYIVYDEVQDLTDLQLLLLNSIVNEANKIMLLGDMDQSIKIPKLNLKLMKDLAYARDSNLETRYMSKNYRNGSEIVSWINEFKKVKNSKFRTLGRIFETAEQPVREGLTPRVFYDFKSERDFFDLISEDADSIVVVWDELDKIGLEKKGYKISRVFTVEDVRGLEYRNVYCYNVLFNLKNALNDDILTKSKSCEIYRVYFNMVYIAASRAKNRLCFIEKDYADFHCFFKDCWKEITCEDTIIKELGSKSDLDRWLKEAKKLERMEKYFQASEAYVKAGREYDAKVCLEANDRKINYSDAEKYGTIVTIQAERLTEKLLEAALDEISLRYGIYIGGYMNFSLYYWGNSGGIRGEEYVGDKASTKDIVGLIYKFIDKKEVSKSLVDFKLCFYKDGLIIDTEKLFGENHKDLLITFKAGKADIKETSNEVFRLLEELHRQVENECDTKLGVSPNSQAERLRKEKEYESKTSDDILDYIFNNKA